MKPATAILFLALCLTATAAVNVGTLTVVNMTVGTNAPAEPPPSDSGETNYTSVANIQSALNSTAVGGVVQVTNSGAIASTIYVTNRVLAGQGAGRVITRSFSSVSVGTGTKVFTVQSGLTIPTDTPLRVTLLGGVQDGVQGNPTGELVGMDATVTSYSGTTLTLNVSAVTGSGTYRYWVFNTLATTKLTNNCTSGPMIVLRDVGTTNSILDGLRFDPGTGTQDYVQIHGHAGQPQVVRNCFFNSEDNYDCIQFNVNQGVVQESSFLANPFSKSQLAIHVPADGETTSWTTASTMGAADTGGTNNLYVEDCDFHAWLNATDFDANGRAVVRHSWMNHSGIGTHGADTGNFGNRHFEVYACTFEFSGGSDTFTLPNNWWFYLRGGTGVIASNSLADINSQDFPGKPEINATVMNLQRNGGPYPCWGADDPGLQYPAPRQVGRGWIDGSAGSDAYGGLGELEPLHYWDNTGTLGFSFSDFGECTNPDVTSDYIVLGRDMTNAVKNGWAPYTYPHPL